MPMTTSWDYRSYDYNIIWHDGTNDCASGTITFHDTGYTVDVVDDNKRRIYIDSATGEDNMNINILANKYEDMNNYYIVVKVPGFKKEDICLELIEEKTIKIHAGNDETTELHENKKAISVEFVPSSEYIEKIIELENKFKFDEIKTKLENGVLTLEIPKNNKCLKVL